MYYYMNELKNLAKFQELLANYHVSKHAKSILNRTKLLLLAGVTSSGRNTVIGEILKTGDYHYITSDTTRRPRINRGNIEVNGEEYWFKTEEEMLKGLQKGEYLEAAIIHDQQVSGISIAEIERASKEQKIAITDIEVVGVANIMTVKPEAVCVFMIPPGFEEWLKRISARGHMTDIELRRRLLSAVKEIEAALSGDHFVIVVNDDFHQTSKVIENILNEIPDQEVSRKVAEVLLTSTKQFLARQ